MDTNYRIYYCSDCDIVAHIDCATNEEHVDETFVMEFEEKNPIESTTTIFKYEGPELDESAAPLTCVVKKIELAEIKHFSHEHDLKLYN